MPMQRWAFKHDRFAGRVQIEYRHSLHSNEVYANPISRLLLLKEAIKHVHDNLVRERETVVAESTDDKLGWALIYSRALENRNFERASHASQCFPDLVTCGKHAFQNCMSLSKKF